MRVSLCTYLSNVVSKLLLFNCNIAQPQIWVRYNDKITSFEQNILEIMDVSNVEGLKGAINLRLKISENITLRKGNGGNLDLKTHISELYNTESEALEVVVDGKHAYEQIKMPLFP